MANKLRLSMLIPAGLAVGSVVEGDRITVKAHSAAQEKTCPLCGRSSRRVHSRYVRTVSDLPWAGKTVELQLVTRRFVCEAPLCRRKIFAERFERDAVPERSRRTSRLEHIVHHLGLALGGRPAAGFAKRLMVPVSNDTLLRVVRRRAEMPTNTLTLASMIGLSGAITGTGGSYAIWSGGGSSVRCPTARLRLSLHGWPAIPRSRSSHATVVAGMERRLHRHCHRRFRWPTAGT